MHLWGLESGFMNYGRPRLIVWETLYWPLRFGDVGVSCLSTIATSIGPGAGKGSNKPHWLPALMPSAYALETDNWVWAPAWSLTTPWSRTSDFAATNLFSSFVIRMTATTMITASICWRLTAHQAVQKGIMIDMWHRCSRDQTGSMYAAPATYRKPNHHWVYFLLCGSSEPGLLTGN